MGPQDGAARYADRDLAERGAVSLDLDRLGELAAELIGEEEAARTVRRLRTLLLPSARHA